IGHKKDQKEEVEDMTYNEKRKILKFIRQHPPIQFIIFMLLEVIILLRSWSKKYILRLTHIFLNEHNNCSTLTQLTSGTIKGILLSLEIYISDPFPLNIMHFLKNNRFMEYPKNSSGFEAQTTVFLNSTILLGKKLISAKAGLLTLCMSLYISINFIINNVQVVSGFINLVAE
ncbi:hypothetical protein ACJX0J_030543, partial [Zea mays]